MAVSEAAGETENPYKGLDTFYESDASNFYGRDSVVAKLLTAFRDLHQDIPSRETPARILSILGPSGSGKSSVARAGLIPELATNPWSTLKAPRVLVFTPGVHPLESLSQVLTRSAGTDNKSFHTIQDEFEARLKEVGKDQKYNGLRRIADNFTGVDEASPLILLIDQFEEVYALCKNAEERNAFIANLLVAACDRSRRVSVILTLRTDFLGATATHAGLNRIIATQHHIVPAMTDKDLRQAISEPARRSGHPIDDATIDLLITETHNRVGVLPLLQFVLMRIWEGMVSGTPPADTLNQIGGVGGALAMEATKLYEALDPARQNIARRAFLAMVTLGEGIQDTRRRAALKDIVGVEESLEDLLEVLRAFSQRDRRLVTLLDEDGEQFAEVTHEALIANWDELKNWLANSRDDQRFQRRLSYAAQNWDQQNRPKGLLWRPPDLDLLKNFAKRCHKDMTALQSDYFQAAQRQFKIGTYLRRGAIASLLILTIVASGAGIFAQSLLTLAEERLADAELNQSKYLTQASLSHTSDGDAVTGILLALEALPEDEKQSSRPYWPKAERALHLAVSKLRELPHLRGHEGPLVSVKFSSDGKRVVTASVDGTARIWKVDDGSEITLLRSKDGFFVSAAFSPDGKRVVTASSDNTAQIWEAKDGTEIALLHGHEDVVWNATFSPDGKRVVTASSDKTARIWNADDGSEIALFRGHQNGVRSATFSPDGKRVVTASVDGTARIWEVDHESEIALLRSKEEVIFSAAFARDGKRVVTSSSDKTARIWNTEDGSEIALLRGHEGPVVSAAFSPDGKYVVTASNDGTARIWKAENGSQIAVLGGHKGIVVSAAFSRDGKRVVTASSDKTARIWNTEDGSEIALLRGHEGAVVSAAFSPDGKRVVTASNDNTARIWNAYGEPENISFNGHENALESAVYSRGGKRVVTASWDNTARIWKAEDGSEVAILSGHKDAVMSAAFSPDDKYVVTASNDGTARIWKAENGSQIAVLDGHKEAVMSAAFSPDGKHVVTASWDKTARIWKADNRFEIAHILDHQFFVRSAAFSPDGKHLVTVTTGNTARIWNTEDGSEIALLRGHEGAVVSAAFSPDGKYVVTASNDNTARIWSRHNGSQIAILRGHEGAVVSAAFSPDGKRVVTASADSTARIWKTGNGSEIAVLFGHEDGLLKAAFSRDSKRVVTASADNTARVWRVEDGSEIALLRGHHDIVVSAAFSPDEKRVITAARDNTARIWEVPILSDLVKKARSIVPRQLTNEQREAYGL